MTEMNEEWALGLYKGEPYISGEQPNKPQIIKLNSNENPYPPAPEVVDTIRDFEASNLRYYSNSIGSPLREALAEHHNVAPNNVFVGNGSDEVLALSFRACFGTGKPLLFPDITYSFYPVWCEFFNIPYETILLNDDFRINVDDYAKENGGVIITNPNAPTSIGESLEFIESILKNNSSSIVIVDEAYADFSEVSADKLLKQYPNLLVVRTFSKSKSLAGMRIGYALGSEKVIAAIIAAKDSFNSYPINSLSIAAGVAAIDAKDYYDEITSKIISARNYATSELSLLGYNVLKSSANFLFVGCDSSQEAENVFNYLREKDILVRYFQKPRIDKYLRITVGTMDEMQQLIDVLKDYK